ncbi:MAG TPA: ATP-dependent DNA helicase PcrA, partial [candidate division WOR-3 bacterium]|nr:ATP-dependent DNA helicase PcrA [candidate division WOR-3 bacterium]
MNYTNLQNSFLIDQINNTLNEKQKEAVLVESGPVLVIAGAGSGKTRVLTYRVAYLTGILGIPPHRIFVATFTNKAAQEMKERINSLMGTQVRDLWIGTFHSLCVRILRKEIWRIGYSQNFSIFDRDDQKKLIKDIVGKGERPDRFIHYISRVKTYGEGIEDRFLNSVFEEYTKKMKLLNALDFDDLLVLTLKIFESFPDVKNHYAERFLHILVDEYQDTNRLQYEIIRHLSSKHRNIFVVGDDDQSIYAFRGADLRNILDFEQDFPDARIIRLEQNYRSTKNILKAASTVIAHNRLRKGKTLWTQNPEGKKIVIFECDTEREEAETVAKIIEKSGREYRDFLILYRTNAQSRAFEERFHLEGIPYQIVGGMKFYERQEIKDILAYLRILVNPKDEIALLRIFNVPPRGIGVKTVETVKNYAEMKKVSLLDALKQMESLDLHKSRKEKLQNFFSL